MKNQSKKLLSVSETIEVLLHAMIIFFCTHLDYKKFFDCAEKRIQREPGNLFCKYIIYTRERRRKL